MRTSDAENAIMQGYADDVEVVNLAKAKYTDKASNLAKASRFLRARVMQALKRHDVSSAMCTVDGRRLEISVATTKRHPPITGANILSVFTQVNPDDITRRAAQLKANGGSMDAASVVVSVLQEKIKENCGVLKEDLKISTKIGEDARTVDFTADELQVIRDFTRVDEELRATKVSKKRDVEKANARIKERKEQISEILARTGTVCLRDGQRCLVFEIKKIVVPAPIKPDDFDDCMGQIIGRIVPESTDIGPVNTFAKLRAPAQINDMASSYQKILESNVHEKTEFNFCCY